MKILRTFKGREDIEANIGLNAKAKKSFYEVLVKGENGYIFPLFFEFDTYYAKDLDKKELAYSNDIVISKAINVFDQSDVGASLVSPNQENENYARIYNTLEKSSGMNIISESLMVELFDISNASKILDQLYECDPHFEFRHIRDFNLPQQPRPEILADGIHISSNFNVKMSAGDDGSEYFDVRAFFNDDEDQVTDLTLTFSSENNVCVSSRTLDYVEECVACDDVISFFYNVANMITPENFMKCIDILLSKNLINGNEIKWIIK